MYFYKHVIQHIFLPYSDHEVAIQQVQCWSITYTSTGILFIFYLSFRGTQLATVHKPFFRSFHPGNKPQSPEVCLSFSRLLQSPFLSLPFFLLSFLDLSHYPITQHHIDTTILQRHVDLRLFINVCRAYQKLWGYLQDVIHIKRTDFSTNPKLSKGSITWHQVLFRIVRHSFTIMKCCREATWFYCLFAIKQSFSKGGTFKYLVPQIAFLM